MLDFGRLKSHPLGERLPQRRFSRKRNQKPSLLRALVVSVYLLSPSLGTAQQIETDDYEISISPDNPTSTDILYVNFRVKNPNICGMGFSGSSLSVENTSARIAVFPGRLIYTICDQPATYSFLLGTTDSPGSWEITVYEDSKREPAPLFSPETEIARLVAQLSFPNEGVGSVYAETPKEGSIQTGIGVVRGWACSAQTVHIQFDEGPLFKAAYGTSRGDTLDICGSTNNGYGMVVNWGAMEPGWHSMRTFIDGQLLKEVNFEVVGLGEEFVRGLTGTYDLEDFPGPGQTTTVQWSEADQDFKIVEVN